MHVKHSMHVKNSVHHFYYNTFCIGHWNKENERKNKTIKLTSWSFSLMFVDLPLAWMLYFHLWLQNIEKCLGWSEHYNQLGIYQTFHASILEPRQGNWSNPEAYSESCQTSEMQGFAKKSMAKSC